jgi:4-carboxymuconolactone decarboxylase
MRRNWTGDRTVTEIVRPPNIDPDSLSAEQKRVHDVIVAGPRGRVEAPLAVWLHSPELAEKAQALGAFCRFGTSLPPRLSELAIVVTAAHWQAGYEWSVHAPIAVRSGLGEAAVEAIREGKEPCFTMEDEAVVFTFSSELLTRRCVSSDTYEKAVSILGTTATIELVGILGYYGLISMTICAFEIPAA